MNEYQLRKELSALEGIISQHPETGKKSNDSYISKYTNRVFGAPYQLLDSVDKRFDGINSYLGNEYLRNFMLNSPILHIRPGMPKYTGSDSAKSLSTEIKKIYMSSNSGNLTGVESLLTGLAESTIFGQGEKLQRRLFGFRETYYDYMQHVNYMCRSVAVFLTLTEGTEFPPGTFTSESDTELKEFSNIKWENYRMLRDSTVDDPLTYLGKLLGTTGQELLHSFGNLGLGVLSGGAALVDWLIMNMKGVDLDSLGAVGSLQESWDSLLPGTLSGTLEDKITAVEFMVEPVSFEESLTNQTKTSMLESAIDSVRDSVGAEMGFITNTHADFGVIDNVMEFLGTTLEDATMSVANMVEPVTGGFMTSLFSGALQSIKGQKMIYPEIYQSSESTMDYSYTVTLTSPYGDAYNYYMNILVPLMHLIALAAPRMVTSNSVASPYLVQAYIPGQCTIQLGIISQMTITKNPNGNRVSVNGFPLEVKVTFTIKELYNAMSISPANDPASFLFNETLNDYMANLAGLIPSIDTYTRQRQIMFEGLESYLSAGGLGNDIAAYFVEKAEDFINPFVAR